MNDVLRQRHDGSRFAAGTRPVDSVSLGLGLTNACNLSCAHCYRPSPPLTYLPLSVVKRACDALPVSGVNLGTGENALHPDFHEILSFLLGRGLRVSLTSNGYSIARLSDETLRALNDVEISIDFPDHRRFDAFRGSGAMRTALGALDRCRSLGVTTTVLAVLMRDNHRDLVQLAKLAVHWESCLRVNAYQPAKSRVFLPSYEEFWYAVGDLCAHTTLLACSERVIRAALGLSPEPLKCGSTSVRITPSGEVLPCVYSSRTLGSVDVVLAAGTAVFASPAFQELSAVPPDCRGCDLLPVCGGGCASRRALMDAPDKPDPYCPKRGGVRLAQVSLPTAGTGRLHTQNVCTLLVSA